MEIPGLGPVTYDPRFGWYQSSPIRVRVLGGVARAFTVEGYDDDPSRIEVHDTISAFLGLDESVLKTSAPSIVAGGGWSRSPTGPCESAARISTSVCGE